MSNDELRSRIRDFPDHADQVLDGDGRPLHVTASNDGMFFFGLVVIVAAVVVALVALALTV